MTKKEIQNFIEKNSEETLSSYFDKLVSKLEITNRSNDKILIWMLLLIFVYFSIDLKVLSNIKVGPFTLSDDSFIKLFSLLIFNYLFLKYATLNAHRSTLIDNIKQVGEKLYNLTGGAEQNFVNTNPFLQMVMPFSIWEEINRTNFTHGKRGCVSRIVLTPMFLLLLSPLVFEIIVIKDLIQNYWCNGWEERVVILTTLWIFIGVITYYFNAFSKKRKDNKNTRC